MRKVELQIVHGWRVLSILTNIPVQIVWSERSKRLPFLPIFLRSHPESDSWAKRGSPPFFLRFGDTSLAGGRLPSR